MYLNRSISSKIQRLVETFPAIVISGARQVGKSTLLSHLFGTTHEHVTFDPIQDVRGAKSDPDLFLGNFSGTSTNPARGLILDEIQYVPELVAAVKREIDRDGTKGRFLITGSQQWEVMKRLAESLAGRAVFVDLLPLSFDEWSGEGGNDSWIVEMMQSPDQFEDIVGRLTSRKIPPAERIWHGWYPGTHELDASVIPDFFSGYIRTYVERDVRLLAQVEDVSQFSRFFRLCAAMTAQEINFSQLGREIGVTPQTANRWLDILSGTFQWSKIEAYSGNVIKKISSKSKGYLSDTGMACFSQAISSASVLSAHPLWGAIFETAVVNEIKKVVSILSPKPNLYHWRAHSGAEVDLIIERDGAFYPIEIKGKSHPSRQDTKGLIAFRETYPKNKIPFSLILAPTQKPYMLAKDIYVIPWDSKLEAKI